MRKATIALLALGLAATLVTPALATQFLVETFTYANGNLAIAPAVSGGNWTSHSGTTGTDIQVVSAKASGSMAQAYDDNRTFAAQTATAKTYACFQATIPQPSTTPIVGNYFAHFKDTGTTNFFARVYAQPVAGDASHFTFAISVSSVDATVLPVPWTAPLNYGTTYNIVTDYNAATGSADLWVNPGSEASPKVTSSTTTATGTRIGFLASAFALRQSTSGVATTGGASGTSNWPYNVDNLGVGTSMVEACKNVVTPTSTATWGQLRTLYH